MLARIRQTFIYVSLTVLPCESCDETSITTVDKTNGYICDQTEIMVLYKTDEYICSIAFKYILTWQTSTLITGVQHMAAAIVLAWVALTQMGAYLCLAVGTYRQQP